MPPPGELPPEMDAEHLCAMLRAIRAVFSAGGAPHAMRYLRYVAR